MDEIWNAVNALRLEELILMHCTSHYRAESRELNIPGFRSAGVSAGHY